MLFPLSRSFSSTAFFQRGGEHSQPIASRNHEADHVGRAARTAECHELLMDRKPYSAHLSLIRRRAEEGRKVDAARARAFTEEIQQLKKRQHAEFRNRRREMHLEIEKYEETRQAAELARSKEFRGQRDDCAKKREEMEARVAQRKPLGYRPPKPVDVHPGFTADPPAPDAAKELKKQTANYFKEMKSLKKSLEDRPNCDWRVQPRRNSTSDDEPSDSPAVEAMKKNSKDYDAFLEQIYKDHTTRIRQNKRQWVMQSQHLDEHEDQDDAMRSELCLRLGLTSHAAKGKFATKSPITMGSVKEFREEIQKKVKARARPKGLGGYAPIQKGERRLRVEDALGASMSAPSLGTGNYEQTLNPQVAR